MKHFATFFVILVAHSSFNQAQDVAENDAVQKSMRDLSMRITFFYNDPTAEKFEEINQLLDQNEATIMQGRDRNRFDVIAAAFLARVHEKHEFGITNKGQIGDLARAIVEKDPNNEEAAFVNDPKIVTPSNLDVWWVSFSATGDTKHLESILNHTGNPREDPAKRVIRGVANWSFKANCAQHEAVRKFAENAATEEKWADQKLFLESCVKAAEDAKPKSTQPASKSNVPQP